MCLSAPNLAADNQPPFRVAGVIHGNSLHFLLPVIFRMIALKRVPVHGILDPAFLDTVYAVAGIHALAFPANDLSVSDYVHNSFISAFGAIQPGKPSDSRVAVIALPLQIFLIGHIHI